MEERDARAVRGLPFALAGWMIKWIVGLVSSMGIYGVALLMAIENVVLPLPSELIMPLAGFASSRGKMSLAAVILAGTIGSVVGALPLRPSDLDKPKRWFARHGSVAVIHGQIIPGVRGLISLPAGYGRVGRNCALEAPEAEDGAVLALSRPGFRCSLNYSWCSPSSSSSR